MQVATKTSKERKPSCYLSFLRQESAEKYQNTGEEGVNLDLNHYVSVLHT